VLLYLKVRIVNGDGTVLADDANVGPVNNFMHSLFERVDVILGDTVVTSSSDMYPYRALLETLLSYSEDAKKSQLTTTLFEKDTAGKMDAYLTGQGGDRNVGLVKRAKFTSQSKPLEMLGKLSCDIFSQDRLLLNKVPFRIRLIRSKDAFSLMTGTNNADFKVNIQSAILMVRRVEVSPSIFIGHQNALRHGPAKYPIKRVVCKYISIPQGNTSTNQENLFQGQMPTRIIVGLVDAAASNGDYKKNPFNFQHKNLTHVALRVGGLKEPIKPITPSFPNQSLLSYVSLLIGTGKFGRDEGCGFARDEHANGYCLHAWDLTADLSDGDTFQLMKNTSVRLELKFSEPLDTPTNVIVYAEFENLILIDADRNITTNYVN
jgi:hypothetical protein